MDSIFAVDAEVTAIVLTVAGLDQIYWLLALVTAFVSFDIADTEITSSAPLGCGILCHAA